MKIACPRCDTRYALSEEALGDQGRKMKCAKCAAIWLALPETPALTARQSLQALRPAQPASVPLHAQIDPASLEPSPPIGASDVERWEEDLVEERKAQNRRSADVREIPVAKPASHQSADKPKRKSGLRRSLAKAFGSVIAGWQLMKRFGYWITHLRFRDQLMVLSALAIPVYLLAGLYAGREFVVRQVPDLAGLYRVVGVEVNLYGLAFEDIRTVRRPENGVAVLIVEGAVRNISRQTQDVPRLHFILSGREREVYSWQEDATPAQLEAGNTVRFRSVLASPPDVADELHVRFFNSDPRLNRL